MVAIDSMTLTEYLSRRVAHGVMRRRERRSATLPRAWFQTLVTLMLQLAGFSCFTIAGFSVSLPAGLIVAGLSCFSMAWLQRQSTVPDER